MHLVTRLNRVFSTHIVVIFLNLLTLLNKMQEHLIYKFCSATVQTFYNIHVPKIYT